MFSARYAPSRYIKQECLDVKGLVGGQVSYRFEVFFLSVFFSPELNDHIKCKVINNQL